MKLNIGCGTDIRRGYMNIDKYPYPHIDARIDIEKPMVFGDEAFSEILAQDILEHVDYTKVMPELYRILEKKGTLLIRVPHFTYHNAFSDPTHKHFFCSCTFRFFAKQDRKQDALYGFRLFDSCKVHIEFEKRPLFFWNYLIEWLVNLNQTMQQLYERTPLRIFPAMNIYVELQKGI